MGKKSVGLNCWLRRSQRGLLGPGRSQPFQSAPGTVWWREHRKRDSQRLIAYRLARFI